MASFEEIKNRLLSILYETAMKPGSPETFPKEHILSLLPDIGHGITNAAITDLSNDGVIYQATLQPLTYKITALGITNAEKLTSQLSSAQEQPSFKSFKNSLLIELAKAEHTDGNQFFDLKTLADNSGLIYTEGWVRKAGNSFRDYGLIREAFSMGGGPDGNMNAKLTAEGLEEAQELTSHLGLHTLSSQKRIPASDRIVKRSDNEEAWPQAAEGVIALREAMIEANDYGDLDEDEFEQKLSEVRALQIMLDAPQVQWEVLDQLTAKTVKYLAMKFADNAIGLAATGLLVYLTTLLQGTL